MQMRRVYHPSVSHFIVILTAPVYQDLVMGIPSRRTAGRDETQRRQFRLGLVAIYRSLTNYAATSVPLWKPNRSELSHEHDSDDTLSPPF